MSNKLYRYGRIGLAVALVSMFLAPAARAQSEQQNFIAKAQTTFSNFVRDPDMTWIQRNLRRAKGVLISPEIVKAGFILGGSGGRSLLLVHDTASDAWHGPAFYTLATGSVGFQAGVSVSENVTLVMSDKGVNTLLAPSMKMGGDASIAAGPVGAGASGDVTSDFVSFSRAKGVYGGLNLDGTVVSINNDWNSAFYGKGTLPPDILIRGSAKNDQAKDLLAAVEAASR